MYKDDIKEIDNEKIKEVLEGGDILKVREDRTFKILFNNLDKKALAWFMAKILEKPIDKIKNVIKEKDSELRPLNEYDKGKRLDFIVEVENELVIVELNNNSKGYDYTRNLYYTFHALLNQITVGDEYHHVHAILVNLNWFKNDSEINKIKPIDVIEYPYPVIGKEYKESIITVKNINLSYFDKMRYNGVGMKDFLWKLFTINNSKDIDDVKKNIYELKNYCSELKRISESREFCMFVWDERMDLAFSEDYHRGKGEGYDEGKKVGLAEGKLENQREMIISLNKNGVSLDIISKSTGLSKEEIQKIIKSNNQQ